MSTPANEFPREASGLPAASATAAVELSGGDRFALRIAGVQAHGRWSGMMFSFDVTA